MAEKKPYRVKVTVGDSVVEVEGEEKGVVAIVQSLRDLLGASRRPPASSVVAPVSSEPTPRSGQVDLRTFFSEKQPSSDVEATAVAAYYYKYLAPSEDRKDTIDAQALIEAFRHGGRPLPARAAYTLVNARNAGYLDSSGEAGAYRLNPVGFNLVEHALGKAKEAVGRKTGRKARGPRRQKRGKGSKT